ncbi:STAS domain-containing protein [Acrocarpospora corrugata]|nr:STAS domain-containing protein [Acrocarpospora corrugata]
MAFDSWQKTPDVTHVAGESMGVQVLYGDSILRITCVVMPSGSSLVRLAGELDASNSAAVLAALTRVCHQDARLVVDVSRVTFVDLSGVRALTALVHDRARVHLREVPPRMAFLLNLLSLRSAEMSTGYPETGDRLD